MARGVAVARRRRRTLVPPALMLAFWRLRQTWRLLLATELGVVAAVVLVCLVPLFSQVTISAGLRDALLAPTSQNGNTGNGFFYGPFPGASIGPSEMTITPFMDPLDATSAGQIRPTVDSFVRQHVGPYLTPNSAFSVVSMPMATQGVSGAANEKSFQVELVGDDLSSASSAFVVSQGRLPAPTATGTDGIEVALTHDGAAQLGVKVGDTISTILPSQGPSASGQMLALHVVGIFGLGSSPDLAVAGRNFAQVEPGGGDVMIGALTSNAGFLQTLGTLEASANTSGGSFNPGMFSGFFQPVYYYQLDLAHVTASDMSDLSGRLQAVEEQSQSVLGNSGSVRGVNTYIPALQALSAFQAKVIVAQIPIVLLLLQVFGLVLLFIQLMSDILVTRQADAIAIMRSRGATRGQVFGALAAQGMGLGIVALVVGPLLAIPLVEVITRVALNPADASAVTAISGNPVASVLGVKWYAIVSALVAAFALILSVRRAASVNVVALRRENARGTAKPFWQRFHLDLIFGLIGLALYGAYLFLLNIVPATVSLVLAPFAMIFTIFLLVSAALLFMRFFPLVLRLLARQSARLRGATAMVAMAQIARAPRQAMRMTLLFALATGFGLFALTFMGSEAQRALDVAAFEVGADFTGTLNLPAGDTSSLSDLSNRFEDIPGVLAASAAYTTNVSPQQPQPFGGSMTILAIDPATYANTTIWQPGLTSKSVADLASTLASPSANDIVPAIIDTQAANAYHVGLGQQFTITPTGYASGTAMRVEVVGLVKAIPTIYDGGYGTIGGMLVSYTTYANVYQQDTSKALGQPNLIWLRTSDDPERLATIRQALTAGATQLSAVEDRRTIIANTQNDALHIDLMSTIGLGAAAALILALLGTWIASWLNARSRLISFAVLRALGSTPTQTMRVLLWEQGIVYLSSLILGCVLGWLLSLAVQPLVVFTDLISSINSQAPYSQLPPARLVAQPSWLLALLGVLIVACVIALIVMTRTVGRAALGQALRLNED